MDSLANPVDPVAQAAADLAELGAMVRYQNEREMARVVVDANRRALATQRLERVLEHWS